MAKANQAYHKRDAAGVAPCQVMTLANHLAKQAVKAHWRDQGRKLQLIEVSELVREAGRTSQRTPNSSTWLLNVIEILLREALRNVRASEGNQANE
jgi:hypothetical protein